MFTVQFKTQNAAFQQGRETSEIKRILEDIADKMARGFGGGKIIDVNGNTVGSWILR